MTILLLLSSLTLTLVVAALCLGKQRAIAVAFVIGLPLALCIFGGWGNHPASVPPLSSSLQSLGEKLLLWPRLDARVLILFLVPLVPPLVVAIIRIRREQLLLAQVLSYAACLSFGSLILDQTTRFWGLLALGGAALILIIERLLEAFPSSSPPSSLTSTTSPSPSLLTGELLSLSTVLLIAGYFRLRELAIVPTVFEGELAPYMLGSTSIHGIVRANAGWSGPWSPLGYFYYLPIYLFYQLFGPTVLVLRLASALPALATTALIYFCSKKLAGQWAAVCASFFYAMECLLIGWGRTDIHPHASTAWTMVVLASLTYSLLERPSFWTIVLTNLMMGLAWHQYPSGQLAAFLPIGALIGSTVLRSLPWKRGVLTTLSLIPGVALWIIGGPLSFVAAGLSWSFSRYFELLGPRVYVQNSEMISESQPVFVQAVYRLFENSWAYLKGIYVHTPYLHHQDIILPMQGMPPRSLSWIVASLGTITVIRMLLRPSNRVSIIMLCWLILGLIPGILSDYPYPKRASVFYPGMVIMAGIGVAHLTAISRSAGRLGGWITRVCCIVGAAGWVATSAVIWFREPRQDSLLPLEERVAQAVISNAKPGTHVILAFRNAYETGQFGYLLHDTLFLKNELLQYPVVYSSTARETPRFLSAVSSISERQSLLAESLNTYLYQWSPAWSDAGSIGQQFKEKQVMIILQCLGRADPLVQEVATRLGSVSVEWFERMTPADCFAVIQSNPSSDTTEPPRPRSTAPGDN